jgi:hypothetical protein
LQSIASNRKFEIEKGLVEYTIRKRITKWYYVPRGTIIN